MDEERYFVGGPGGQRFGPATVEELRLWHKDKRVQLSSILIRESDEATFTASEILGLPLPPIPAQAPSQAPGQPTKRANTGVIVTIVVVATLCLCCGPLGAILYPAFAKAKLASEKTAEQANIKRVAFALMVYASDNDETLPPDMSSSEAMRPLFGNYIGAQMAKQKGEDMFKSVNPAGGQILVNIRLQGINTSKVENPPGVVMVYDSVPWSGSTPFATLDGGSRWRPQSEFEQLLNTPLKLKK